MIDYQKKIVSYLRIKNKVDYLFYLSLTFIFISLFFKFFFHLEPDIHSYQKELSSYLEKEEVRVTNEAEDLIEKYQKHDSTFNFAAIVDQHLKTFDNEVFFYLYNEGQLVYWSDNSVPIDKYLSDIQFSKTLVRLQNGWYYPIVIRNKGVTCLGLILVKSVYQYHNNYLSDAFPRSITIPNDISVTLNKSGVDVLGASGNYLCSLEGKQLVSKTGSNELASLFFVISVIFLIFYVLSRIKEKELLMKYPIYSLAFCLLIVVVRLFLLYYQRPVFLYQTYLFSPLLYASSVFFPSFGDLFVNAILFLFITFILFSLRNRLYISINKLYLSLLMFSIGWIFIFYISSFCFYLIEGLILNSEIVLDVNNIFDINLYSILGFVIITIILFALVLSVALIVFFISRFRLSKQLNGLIFIAAFVIGIIIYRTDLHGFIIHVIAPLSITAILFYFESKKEDFFKFSVLIPIIVLLSILSTITMISSNQEKEIEHRKTLAMSLAQDQDPLAEMSFTQIETKVVDDSVLLSYINKNLISESQVIEYLKGKYFSESWKKYDMQFTICRGGDSLLIKPDNIQRDCFSFFNELIYRQGRPTISCNLYFLDKKTGRTSYIAFLSFDKAKDYDARNTRIFIEFDSRFVSKGMGYPELLMDERYEGAADISDYSFARYYNNQLTNQYGKYQYSLWLQQFGDLNDDFTEITENGMHHLIYRYNKDNVLILSKKQPVLLDFLTPFSYLFALITVFALLMLIIVNKKEITLKVFSKNLKARIQFSMVIIVFLSLVIIGISSIVYIVNLYRTKNISDIKEKTHSINIEMESRLGSFRFLEPQMDVYIQDILIKFSNVFFTDINLYDTRGILITSSRGRIFDEGLIGTQMNAKAFSQMSEFNKTLFVHDESIGSLSYLSAYTPLRNSRNELLGYLNLPYFAKQNEMRNEISTFVVTLINIYVLLFALAIIGAILVSNYITSPLRLIKEKMGLLKLGIHSETIEWNSRDEIGSLVEEYNKTVEKLELSAEMLAKSERESAWREMAKQVAHEIKNPLTPMKLNVQYLEKAWLDKAPDWDQRLKKFSLAMIEQIDTLSNIASAFSDFAKLPTLRTETVDLNLLIPKILDLYSDLNYNIIYSPKNIDFAHVRIDKNQINQVFTNLIKNANQAIPDSVTGIISITLENIDKNYYLISVIDNGVGIDEAIVDKIFMPSFTTKSSGMGLGLAMVKNIIEIHGGKIWFESEKGVGTKFFFTLPKFEE